MKSILYILSSSVIAIVSCATRHSNCEGTTVEGYLVTRFLRSEVESYYQNLERKRNGKSYALAIDMEHETYFVPLDSISDDLGLSRVLLNRQHYYNRRPFLMPSQYTRLYIAKFCGEEIKEDVQQQQLDSEYYFELEADSAHKYLYNIWSLEGHAAHAKIENTFFNRRYLSLRYAIDKDLTIFDCYFIYKMQLDDDDNLQKGFRRVELSGDVIRI